MTHLNKAHTKSMLNLTYCPSYGIGCQARLNDTSDVAFHIKRFAFYALFAPHNHYISVINELPHSTTRRHPV